MTHGYQHVELTKDDLPVIKGKVLVVTKGCAPLNHYLKPNSLVWVDSHYPTQHSDLMSTLSVVCWGKSKDHGHYMMQVVKLSELRLCGSVAVPNGLKDKVWEEYRIELTDADCLTGTVYTEWRKQLASIGME
tara:strand:- start:39006 stop:39401 length:396 start_codon:yes stop_codon:yes gene_type:complete